MPFVMLGVLRGSPRVCISQFFPSSSKHLKPRLDLWLRFWAPCNPASLCKR